MRFLAVSTAVVCMFNCLAFAGDLHRPSEEERKTMAEAKSRELDRPSGRYEASRSPADGQRLAVNPPVFVWLAVEGVNQYFLQYSQDPTFRDGSTVTVKQDAKTEVGAVEPAIPGPDRVHVPSEAGDRARAARPPACWTVVLALWP